MLITSIQWVNALLGCTSKTTCLFLVLVRELTPEICPSILDAPCTCHLAILHTSVTIIISSWCHKTCIKTLIFIHLLLFVEFSLTDINSMQDVTLEIF